MIYVTDRLYDKFKDDVELLYNKYVVYLSFNKTQLPAFILNELQNQFDEEPELEVIALSLLANFYKNDPFVLRYIKSEFEYCRSEYLIVVDDSINDEFKEMLLLLI